MNVMGLLFYILLALMLCFGVAAVLMRNLVKAALCLAGSSACLAVILCFLAAPWAAIFELSVCSGLITVITISAISLTTPYTKDEENELIKQRRTRYIALPFILLIVGVVSGYALLNGQTSLMPVMAYASTFASFKEVLWQLRQVDILGQIIMLLAGVFAVVVLFKERDEA